MKTCNTRYERLIADVVQRHLGEPVIGLTPIPTYPDSIVYTVQLAERTVIFKASDPAGRDPDGIALEAWACEQVRAAGVPAPRVLAVDTSTTLIPCSFFLMEQVAGQPLSSLTLPAAQHRRVVRQIGHVVRRIHTIPLDGFGWLDEAGYRATGQVHGAAPTWPAAILAEVPASLAYLEQTAAIDPGLANTIRRLIDAYRPLLEGTTAGSLLHGDLGALHVWVDPVRERVTGIVDWGERSVGDPMWDLAAYEWDDVPVLLEGYAPDAAMEATWAVKFYLYAMLRAVPWACKWHARGAETIAWLNVTVREAVAHL